MLAGRCHCGNVELAFETALAPGDLPLRRCGCTFCRKHGALAVTDPQGSLAITARDPARIIHYQFGQRSADFLLCGGCGVYIAAVMDGVRASLNANLLDCLGELTQPAAPIDYGAEGPDTRRERRMRVWTPLRASP